ncbi:MAG TPA: ethanolamine utilization protein EutM [Armatimonadetes bacterium]|nr:ethanolamine utilization protein EutM [Armatimonadota bacterium]
MAQESLGMIEVVGLVPALAAGDAAAKAANVSLLPLTKSPGRGLVTVYVSGEVAAVSAAVEAGAAEARRVGTLVSTHVIARPSTQLANVVPGAKPGPAAS